MFCKVFPSKIWDGNPLVSIPTDSEATNRQGNNTSIGPPANSPLLAMAIVASIYRLKKIRPLSFSAMTVDNEYTVENISCDMCDNKYNGENIPRDM
jgi:hypothetical protein